MRDIEIDREKKKESCILSPKQLYFMLVKFQKLKNIIMADGICSIRNKITILKITPT